MYIKNRVSAILPSLLLCAGIFGSVAHAGEGDYYKLTPVIPAGELPGVSVTVPESGTVTSVLKQAFKGTGVTPAVHPLFGKHRLAVALEPGASENLDVVARSLADSGDFTWSYAKRRFTVVHYGRFITQVPEAVVKQGKFTKRLRELGARNVVAGWHGRVTFKATPKVLAVIADVCEQERAAATAQKGSPDGSSSEAVSQ